MKSILLLLTLCSAHAQGQVKAYPPERTSEPSAKIEIRVRAMSEVGGPRYTLGEIAEIIGGAESLGSIDMGPAPVAGVPRPLMAARIQAALLVAGLKAKDFTIELPVGAKVALKTQSIPHSSFVSAAEVAVRAIVGESVGLISAQTPADFQAPLGEVSLQAGTPSRSATGYAVLVNVFVAGKRLNSRLIQLTVDASSLVSITAGAPVKILIRSAGATIELSGKARTGGYAGQLITVVSSTGSVHQAKVLSASEVEVKL